jgi:hypothetical protein
MPGGMPSPSCLGCNPALATWRPRSSLKRIASGISLGSSLIRMLMPLATCRSSLRCLACLPLQQRSIARRIKQIARVRESEPSLFDNLGSARDDIHHLVRARVDENDVVSPHKVLYWATSGDHDHTGRQWIKRYRGRDGNPDRDGYCAALNSLP